MAVYNFGSVNLDHIYRVERLPAPGETVVALDHRAMLGGKGANQSVAAARAGAITHHIGMIGRDGAFLKDELRRSGVHVDHVLECETPTSHANVYVNHAGENLIVVAPGANNKQSLTQLEAALKTAGEGDVFLCQNETTLVREAAALAREAGCYVIYSAAPFEADRALALAEEADLIVMNEVEAEQFHAVLGTNRSDHIKADTLITRGEKGALWDGIDSIEQPAFAVTPVDTTGAGDCFIGYVAAGFSEGLCKSEALRLGAAAAALQVTRAGTSEAIPSRDEVEAFLASQ